MHRILVGSLTLAYTADSKMFLIEGASQRCMRGKETDLLASLAGGLSSAPHTDQIWL